MGEHSYYIKTTLAFVLSSSKAVFSFWMGCWRRKNDGKLARLGFRTTHKIWVKLWKKKWEMVHKPSLANLTFNPFQRKKRLFQNLKPKFWVTRRSITKYQQQQQWREKKFEKKRFWSREPWELNLYKRWCAQLSSLFSMRQWQVALILKTL